MSTKQGSGPWHWQEDIELTLNIYDHRAPNPLKVQPASSTPLNLDSLTRVSGRISD